MGRRGLLGVGAGESHGSGPVAPPRLRAGCAPGLWAGSLRRTALGRFPCSGTEEPPPEHPGTAVALLGQRSGRGLGAPNGSGRVSLLGRGNTPTKGRLGGCFRERSEKPAKGWGAEPAAQLWTGFLARTRKHPHQGPPEGVFPRTVRETGQGLGAEPAKGWGLGSETPAEGVSGQLGKPAASIASAYAICPATFGCRLEALGPVGP